MDLSIHQFLPDAVRERVATQTCRKCCNPFRDLDIIGVGYEAYPRPGHTLLLIVHVTCSLCFKRSTVAAGHLAQDMAEVATGKGTDLFQTLNGPPPPSRPAATPPPVDLDPETIVCDDGVPPDWYPSMRVLTTMRLRLCARDTAVHPLAILGGYQPVCTDRDIVVSPPVLLYRNDHGEQPHFDLLLAEHEVGRAIRCWPLTRLRWRADWLRFGQVPAKAAFKIGDKKCFKLTSAAVKKIVGTYEIWQDGQSPGLGQPAVVAGNHLSCISKRDWKV
jgi:hypothetical protein